MAAEHRVAHRNVVCSTEIPELDALLGGGLSGGTSTLIIGPAGCGKSTLAGAFARSSAAQCGAALVCLFEETKQTYLKRMKEIGLSLTEDFVASGRIMIEQVDPAELSPGEFAQRLRVAVEEQHVRTVVIDSINGYLNAMPNDRFLITQLHELLSYLAEKEVITLMVVAQYGMIGSSMVSPVEVSYLADVVILMRFFEFRGALKKAVSVVKNRVAGPEDTIRELKIGQGGIRVGRPLTEFQGILTGTPHYRGEGNSLLKEAENEG